VPEKINLWKGKAKIRKYSNLREVQMDTDLTTIVKELSIPIVFMSGKFDYTVNWELSKKFYDNISDENKKFIIFENSAHSPMFEERDRFLTEMINVRNLYKK
jgi:esterase/lipase